MGTAATLTLLSGAAVARPVFIAEFEYTFSASYTTGGEAVDLSALLPTGATVIDIIAQPKVGTAEFASYDRTNAKLIAYELGTDILDEISATTDLASDGAFLCTVFAN
jgi:hypothetical protein